MSGSAPGLGLRSGSYDSLAAAVGGSGGGGGARKAAARGWALRGEKERLQLLHRTLRLVGRRRAGVLLLLAVASAAVFCSLFAVVKGGEERQRRMGCGIWIWSRRPATTPSSLAMIVGVGAGGGIEEAA